MRRVQLPDHLHDHVVQLIRIGDVGQQRLISLFGGRPINAMHPPVVEPVLHHAPGLLEDLPALGRRIHLHPGCERDAPARRRCRLGRRRRSAGPAHSAPEPAAHRRRLRLRRRPMIPARSPCKSRFPAGSRDSAHPLTIAIPCIRRTPARAASLRSSRPARCRSGSAASHLLRSHTIPAPSSPHLRPWPQTHKSGHPATAPRSRPTPTSA